MNKCFKENNHGLCCCNCKYHIEDFHSCSTTNDDELRKNHKGCVCSVHKGWICMPPEFNGAHSGWTEHGICEIHEMKND